MGRFKKRVSLVLATVMAVTSAVPGISAIEAQAKTADKSVGATPVMGWNSWNTYFQDISEEKIKRAADALVSTGLRDAGYEYVVVDDGYLEDRRDEVDGHLVPNASKFPNGFKVISDYVHELGMKYGMYNSSGTYTCGRLPGSWGHEETDARTFTEWGVDYFKYDFCFNPLVIRVPDYTDYAPDIDKLLIYDSDNTIVKEVEAESGKLEGGATNDGYGNKVVGYIGTAGGKVTLDVPMDQGGDYSLGIVYVSAEKRNICVDINGFKESKSCPPTSGWELSDSRILELPVTLNTGDNQIQLYLNNDDIAQNNERYAYESYKKMSDAFDDAGANILFNICEWGENNPWKWGPEVGHCWRTTTDITFSPGQAKWDNDENGSSIMQIYDKNVILDEYAGPYHYNDPDMLAVGLNGLNDQENVSHFSLWCMMASPLIIGCDPSNTDANTLRAIEILSNKDLIAINQDELGVQAKRYRDDGDLEYLVKPLANGDLALLMLNRSPQAQNMSADIGEAASAKEFDGQKNFLNAGSYSVKDLWTGETINVTDTIQTSVPSHGVKVYRIAEEKSKQFNITWDANGGTPSPEAIFVLEGNMIGTLPQVTRVGWEFEGWFTSLTGQTQVTEQTLVTGDMTLYAHWKKAEKTKYQIAFNSNGGAQKPPVLTREAGSMYGTLPAVTRDGYKFLGWYDGSKKVSQTDLVTNNVTLTAKWEKNKSDLPGKFTVKAKSQTISSLKLAWSKSPNAVSYKVSRYDPKLKKWKHLKTTTGNSFKDTELKAGRKYKYRVTALNKENRENTVTIKTAAKPSRPRLTVKISGKSATLTWNKIAADKVVVYMKKGNGRYIKMAQRSAKTRKFKKNNLKKSTEYKFKIRAYVKEGSAVYSKYSAVKTVRIK